MTFATATFTYTTSTMLDEKNTYALQFASTLAENGEPTGHYEKRIIGMHDHWLSEEEAQKQIIFYQGIKNEPDYQRYLQQEANIVALYLAVHACAPLQVYDEAEKQFQALHEVSMLIQHATLGAREKGHYLFYSPKLDSIWTDAHDVAVVLYLLDPEGKPAAEKTIAQLANAHHLHMLH